MDDLKNLKNSFKSMKWYEWVMAAKGVTKSLKSKSYQPNVVSGSCGASSSGSSCGASSSSSRC